MTARIVRRLIRRSTRQA